MQTRSHKAVAHSIIHIVGDNYIVFTEYISCIIVCHTRTYYIIGAKIMIFFGTYKQKLQKVTFLSTLVLHPHRKKAVTLPRNQ